MLPHDVKSGSMIAGRRVAAMTRGLVDGHPTVTVRFAETDRKGRKRLSAPVTYLLGDDTPIPGTRRPTTHNMPAGPVGSEPGGKLHGGWWGDGDDNGRDARTDRHSRMIDSLTYV